MRHHLQALLQIRPLCHHILYFQPEIIGMAQHIGSVWLNPPTHKERDGITAIFEPRNGLNSHHPAFIGIETPDLKKEEAAWIALPRYLLQLCRSSGINR